MKRNVRKYGLIVASSLTLALGLAGVSVYQAKALPMPKWLKPPESGPELNEYHDPSTEPRYHQHYHQIDFGTEGISYQDWQAFQDATDIASDISIQAQAKDTDGNLVDLDLSAPLTPEEQSYSITQISYNSAPENTDIEQLNFYRGKDEQIEQWQNFTQQAREDIKAGKLEEYLPKQDQILEQTIDQIESKKSEIEGKVNPDQNIARQWQESRDNRKTLEARKAIIRQELTQDISQIQQKIHQRREITAKRSKDWQETKTQHQGQILSVTDKITQATEVSNRELMDLIYPTREEVDQMNQEILAEYADIKKYKLDQIWKREEAKKRVMNMVLPPTAQAEYLNNFISTLVMYPRNHVGLRLDLMWSSTTTGNQFHLWDANGGGAQKFIFVDDTGEVKHAGSGKCVDRGGNGYYNGVKIQLWPCNGGEAQKWFASGDGTIRPVYNINYCIDASQGLQRGSIIHLWQCHGGDNQKFQIGEEDFGKFDYYIRLHSSKSGQISSGVNVDFTGHTLISMPKRERSTNHWHITNTFSFWPQRDGNATNNGGRTNNMRNRRSNGTWSSINIDGGDNQDVDWAIGTSHPADLGGEFGGYRRTTSAMSKQRYEELKFMRGYQTYNPVQGKSYVDSNYTVACVNCASYSLSIWNQYRKNGDISFGGCWIPRIIYDNL